LQLLDEQVLEEQFKRVSAILPPQRTVAFTYDRLLEYLLLNRLVEKFGINADMVAECSNQSEHYLPLRGVLVTLLIAKADEGAFTDVAAFLRSGNPEVMKSIGLSLLMELELMNPAIGESSERELGESVSGQLIEALLDAADVQTKRLLIEFGENLQKSGHYRRAGFLYDRLIAVLDESSEAVIVAKVWEGAGVVHGVFGRNQEALRYYEKSLEAYRSIGDQYGEQEILDAIGQVYFALGEFAMSRQYYERSLTIDSELVSNTRSKESRYGQAQSLLNLSDNFHRTGEIGEAMDCTQQAARIYQDIDDQRGFAASLRQLGVLSRRNGLMEEARQYEEQALAKHQEIGDRRGVANDYEELGSTHQSEGKWDEALIRCQRAREIYEELGDKAGLARTLNLIGEVHRWKGSFDDALSAYTRALEIYKEIDGKLGVSMCLTNLGATHLFAGDPEQAFRLLKEARALDKDMLPHVEGDPENLAYLSAAAWTLGRHEDALSYSDAAMRVLESKQFGEEDYQLTYYYRYRILKDMDRETEAFEALRVAFADLMQQADAIKNTDARDVFLHSFPVRVQIIEAWHSRQSP
ncbi:MAG: tetratricopeptide repeat protein, partial [Nitrososphaeraceae archaeon]